jgi:hypothetical protein
LQYACDGGAKCLAGRLKAKTLPPLRTPKHLPQTRRLSRHFSSWLLQIRQRLNTPNHPRQTDLLGDRFRRRDCRPQGLIVPRVIFQYI